MRQNILLTLVVAVLLSTSGVRAQRVESNLVGVHPVINCEKMSPLVYSATKKGNTEAALKTERANATVYKRFAVHKSVNSISSQWSNAFVICSQLADAPWRLPTQRELMLIWVLKRELELKGLVPLLSSYWSATESNQDPANGWNVVFNGIDTTPGDEGDKGGNTDVGGATPTNIKTLYYNVRCIKEL